MAGPAAQAPPAGGTGSPTHLPAGLDRRFYAFVIDRLLGWTLYVAAAYLAYRLLDSVWAGVGLVAGVVVLVVLVHAVLLGAAGVSAGKAATGLRVVHHETGMPIRLGPALVRTLVLGLSALPTAGLGVATVAWTAVTDPSRARRGWHDRVAGSVVLDVRPVPTTPDDDQQDDLPRQVVNLTAMRLMPAPEPAAAEPTPAPTPVPPTSPPPAASAPSSAPPPPPPPTPPPAPSEPRTVTPTPPGGRWQVTFDTGEALLVEGLVLVGRRPQARRGEQADRLVALPSEDMSLSKTHAQFEVASDGALVVMDRGSTNGSMLIRQGVAKQLSAGRPATLIEGDRVRFGDREMSVARA